METTKNWKTCIPERKKIVLIRLVIQINDYLTIKTKGTSFAETAWWRGEKNIYALKQCEWGRERELGMKIKILAMLYIIENKSNLWTVSLYSNVIARK